MPSIERWKVSPARIALTAVLSMNGCSNPSMGTESAGSTVSPADSSGGSTTEECPAGQMGCPCLEGLCGFGEMCIDGVCVDAGLTSTTTAGTSDSSGSESEDPGSTGDEPVDRDGDGFLSDLDCDDSDPNTYPLREGQVNEIKAEAVICGGEYHDARIRIVGVQGVDVVADGVTIVDTGAGNGGPDDFALEIDDADDTTVFGLVIRAWAEVDPILVNAAARVTLTGLRVEQNGSNFIEWNASPDGTFRQCSVYGHQATLRLIDSPHSLIEDNDIHSTSDSNLIPSTILTATSDYTQIRGNSVRGQKIVIAGVVPNYGTKLVDNILSDGASLTIDGDATHVQGGSISSAKVGVTVTADKVEIAEVEIQDVEIGVRLDGDYANVHDNSISASLECIHEVAGHVGNSEMGNTCS